MGQDYSYSQPSSSDQSLTWLLEEEAALYADEHESSYIVPEPVQYDPQPEVEDGIPTTCYCGSDPVVATSYTRRDPGRRYFTCENVDDGDCHVWKWCDVAFMEEMRDFQTPLRQVKNLVKESEQRLEQSEQKLEQSEQKLEQSEQKLVKLETTVFEFAKMKSGVGNGFQLVVCLMATVLVILGVVLMFKREELRRLKHQYV